MKTNQTFRKRIAVCGGSVLAALALTGALLLISASVIQSGEQLEVQLKAAVHKELVDGDLEGAIAGYKSILTRAGTNRAIAAKALVQMGKCYEKLGNSEAQKAYQQVVRDYSDQAEQVEQARARLAALKSGAAEPQRELTMAIRRVPSGTAGQALDMYTKPSPDGRYLAYTDWKTGNLAVLEMATGATRLLTKDGSWGDVDQYAGFSAWSRDNKRIAYVWSVDSAKKSHADLRVVSLDGSAVPATIATPGTVYDFPIQWTRDGSRILCAYQGSSGRSEVGLISMSGGEAEKLNIQVGSGWIERQFTEDGNSILYSYPADGMAASSDIYRQDLKAGETTAVIEHPAEDLLAGLVPGTNWLLFASDRRGSLDLWGVQFRDGKASAAPVLVKQGLGRFFPLGFTDDGRYYYATLSVTDNVFLADFDPENGRISGAPRKLASRWEGTNMNASFSPDGDRLAYVAKRNLMRIGTHTADSLVLQSLKDGKADPVVVGFEEFGLTRADGPCWADDGRSVVVGGFQGRQKSGLYRIDLPGLKKTEIYSVPAGRQLDYHVCSSRGRFVYLVESSAVIRIDLDGGNAKELYKAPPGRISIDLSPDGKTLAIIQSVDRNRRTLLLMPSQGGAARQVREFVQPSGGGVSLTWSPDGKSIFYIVIEPTPESGKRHFIIARVPVDGGKVSEQSFEFDGPFFSLQFHPNGRLVTFTGRNGASTESEVWVIENLKNELKTLLPAAGEKP